MIKQFDPANFVLLETDGASSCKLARASACLVFPWLVNLWCPCHQISLWGINICKDPCIVAVKKGNELIIKFVRR